MQEAALFFNLLYATISPQSLTVTSLTNA